MIRIRTIPTLIPLISVALAVAVAAAFALSSAIVERTIAVGHDIGNIQGYSNPDVFWRLVQAHSELAALIVSLDRAGRPDADEGAWTEAAKRAKFVSSRMADLQKPDRRAYKESVNQVRQNLATFNEVAALGAIVATALIERDTAELDQIRLKLSSYLPKFSKLSSENFGLNSELAYRDVRQLIKNVRKSEWEITALAVILFAAIILMAGLLIWLIRSRIEMIQLLKNLQQSQHREAVAIKMRDERMHFLRTMSHELRTPLNGIIGVLDLIRAAKAHRVPELLNTATASAESLLEIVADVLELSKLDQAEVSDAPRPFDLRRTANGVILALKPIADQKGVKLDIMISETVPEWLMGTPSDLRQIIVNLVGNAVKFTDEGSVDVVLSSGPIDTRGFASLHVKVTDTGVGMSNDVRERIFQEFFCVSANRGQSSGLGLSIVDRLIKQMNGDIRCESREGKGTTFTVILEFPVSAVPPAQLAANDRADGACEQAQPLRILLVDDNQTNAMIALEMLEETPHSVSWAQDGLKAVQMAIEGDFQVVFMDISMPGIDGIEACRRIRNSLTAERMPQIIALTAHAITGDRERFLARGFDGYLSKPLRRRTLLSALSMYSSHEGPANKQPADGSRDANSATGEQDRNGSDVDLDRSTPVLDPVAFREFVDERPPATVNRLLSLCITELGSHLKGLQTASRTDDVRALEHHFHTIKSLAATVGAETLRQTSETAEYGCAALETQPRQELTARIVADVAECIENLKQKLEEFIPAPIQHQLPRMMQ